MSSIGRRGVSGAGALPELEWTSLPMADDRAVGWRVLREAGPIVVMHGAFYLTRRHDVLAALQDPMVFSSNKAFGIPGGPLKLVPIAFDPPEHTRYRRILQPFFAPSGLAPLLPSLRQQAIDLIDAATARGRCDVLADIAIPYPMQILLTLFDLPLEDRDRLTRWKNAITAIGEPGLDSGELDPALELSRSSGSRYRQVHNLGRNVVGLLTGDDAFDDDEAIGLCCLLTMAGLDT